MWNVNIICDSAEPKTIKELIETLWNVNNELLVKTNELFMELIETLWNVNCIQGIRVDADVWN